MAGPWELYQNAPAAQSTPVEDGPWSAYQTAPAEAPIITSPIARLVAGQDPNGAAKENAIREANKIEAASKPGTFSDMSVSAMQSVPYGEEIVSGVLAPVRAAGHYIKGDGFDLGRSYDEQLELERELQRRRDARSPVASTVGKVAGGLATAKGLTPNLSAFSPITRILGNAGAAAVTGGLYDAGLGEGGEDRLKRGIHGAIFSGLLGGGLSTVAEAAPALYRALLDRSARAATAKAAGTTPQVVSALTDTFDGSLGPQGMAAMNKAGAEAMIADASPEVRSVLDTAVARGGRAGNIARERIEQRVARGSADLNNAMDSTLGTPKGAFTARKDIRTGTQSARGTAYDDAYAQPIDYADPRGQALEALVKNRVPQSAITRANELMRAEGAASKQILAKVGNDGMVTFETLPDVRQLDYITRGLNDIAEAGEGAGAMGGMNQLGNAYQGLSREIRSTLRNLVPKYGEALDTAADAIGQSKAVQFGSKLLSPGMARDEAAYAIKGMSAAEKTHAAQAVRSQIDEQIANVTRTVQDGDVPAREAIAALKKLSSRANREKVSALIGDAEATKLFDEMDRIATSFDLRASVASNSRTMARTSVENRVKSMNEPGAIGTAARGRPLEGLKKVAAALTGNTPEAISARENDMFAQIADFLTRPANQSLPAYQAMTNYGSQSLANQVRAGKVARALLNLQPTAYPISTQLPSSRRE